MVRSYEYLPHTADVKFVARGKTFEGAFRNAAYALADIVTDHKKVKDKVLKDISIESENKEALLYDFLEQFIIMLDESGFLLSKVKSLKVSKHGKMLKLIAKVTGDTNNKRYKIDTHIKAVTYQQMYIKKSKGEYVLQVILDI